MIYGFGEIFFRLLGWIICKRVGWDFSAVYKFLIIKWLCDKVVWKFRSKVEVDVRVFLLALGNAQEFNVLGIKF
jgi:hypothetical protein